MVLILIYTCEIRCSIKSGNEKLSVCKMMNFTGLFYEPPVIFIEKKK